MAQQARPPDHEEELLTIGQLAGRAGVRPSTLRYYEQEGLLEPETRSPAGYRLYRLEALESLNFIQRAQHLGFSLSDIRLLLAGWRSGNMSDQAILDLAETRHLALERQVTESLVQQHELELFLQDLRQQTEGNGRSPFSQLVDRICADPDTQPAARTVLDWLMRYTGCILSSETGQALLERLRGQHVHIWQEDGAYHVLVVSDDPAVGAALQELAQLEEGCLAHPAPLVTPADEGYLLVARGENAFIFARLFLALEQEGR